MRGPDVAPDLLGLLARVGCHVYTGLVDEDGTYHELFTGPGLAELIGAPLPPGADPTEAFHAAVHPDDWELYQEGGTQIAVDSTVNMEYRLVQPDGSVRWLLDRMWLRERLAGGVVLVDGVITDITELHDRTAEARAALQAAEQANRELGQANLRLQAARTELEETTSWLQAAVTASPAALILLDREARVRLWNPAAERMFGWSSEEVMGAVAPHVPPDRRQALFELLDRASAGEPLLEVEEVRHDRHGVPRHVSISSAAVRGSSGEVTGFMGLISDISARKEFEAKLRHLAHIDQLTGLANRTLLTERIDEATRELAISGGAALLLLDLDGFKSVNDSMGHGVGDELLTAVAGRLISCLRGGDLAARLGGDEFAVLLTGVSSTEAVAVAKRILRTVGSPISLRRADVVITASIGLVYVEQARGTEDLLRDADVAMYEAKGTGRNRLVMFHPQMQERVAARLRLETELRDALENEQLELHYQPFVHLETGRTVGVEALLRWRHPQRGLLAPAEFLRVAEETGLIVPIGRWAIGEACRQAAVWQGGESGRLLSVSVNLSPGQLYDPKLVELVVQALARAGLPAAALTVEITEDLLLAESSLATERLEALRAMGVRIAVDDFGTGYCSLAYLRRFPVDMLKIDRSFVSPVAEGHRPAALVRSIIELARALDLDTVAEGVECAAQAALLLELGCRVAQGHHFARPQPAAAVSRLLVRTLSRAG